MKAGWAFSLLGAIASALALFSLLQHLLHFGMSDTVQLVLSEYRAAIAPLRSAADLLLDWLGIRLSIPGWYADLLVVSAVGAVSASRVVLLDRDALAAGLPLAILLPWQALVTLLATVTLFGCILLLCALPLLVANHVVGAREYDPVHIVAGREMARQCVYGIAGTMLFFALNAFGG